MANLGGGNDDAGNPGGSSSGTSSGSTSSSGGSSSGSSSGVASEDGGLSLTQGVPVGPFACDGGVEPGTLSDGSGFNAVAPLACNNQDGGAYGPPESFASAAAVTSAIVGTWFDCGGAGGSTGTSITSVLTGSGSANLALQLTSGGQFTVLEGHGIDNGDPSTPANWTMLPGAELGDGGQGGPVTGTYQVADASATLGPGTYQITLQASAGGSYVAQVLVLSGSPNMLRFVFSTGPSVEDFSPALPLTFRAGVCDNGPFGPDYVLPTDAEITSRITGSWFWCDGIAPGAPVFDVIGITFPGDGTWWNLTEDSTGTISRITDGADHGALTVSGGLIDPQPASSTASGAEAALGGQPAFAACSTKMAIIGPSSGPQPVSINQQPWWQKSSTTY
jgi:hypothetical protein